MFDFPEMNLHWKFFSPDILLILEFLLTSEGIPYSDESTILSLIYTVRYKIISKNSKTG